jgi:maleylacetate reductase
VWHAAVLDWNLQANPEQQAIVAGALGAARASDGVRALVRDLGLPGRLREVGVSREQLPAIAASALSNRWVRTNPRPIRTAADVVEILESAW